MPAQPVPGIRTEAAVPNWLTSARALPSDIEWEDGISFPSSCPVVKTWPKCTDGEQTKDEAGSRSPVTFEPVTLYLPLKCDMVIESQDDIDADARSLLDVGTASQVAKVVQTGTTDHGVSNNASLTSVAVPLNTGTGISPGRAIGELLAARDGCIGPHYLHVPVQLLPYLVKHNLAVRDGNLYVGPGGAIVLVSGGYAVDEGPIVDEEQTPTPAGSAWVYATGPVEHAVGAIEIFAADDERRRNTRDVIAERNAIYRFDTCCVYASLVLLLDECCEPVVTS